MKKYLKILFSYCLIVGLGIVVSCKPTEPIKAKISLVFWVGLIEGPSQLGLIINDPIGLRQYAVFGKRDADGNIISVSNILSSEPATGRWVSTDFDTQGRPTGFHTGDGRSVSISRNPDGSYRTRTYETATNRTLTETASANPNADMAQTLQQLQRDAEALLAGIRSAQERAARLADMAYLASNLFGCVSGLGALGSGLGTVAAVLGAYGTYDSCKSALEAAQNMANGLPAYGCYSSTDARNDLLGAAAEVLESTNGLTSPASLASIASNLMPDLVGSGTQLAGAGRCRERNAAGSHGDPHLFTTDGVSYGFHGHGEFIASKSTTDNFEIQVRQEDNYKTGSATLNTALAIQTGSDVVCVTLKPATLYINNKAQSLNFTSLSLKDGARITRVATTGRVPYLNIYSKSGDLIKVWFEGVNYLDFQLSLSEGRKGKVIGTLGNNDNDPKNDLQLRDGTRIYGSFTDLYPKFADSWRIEQANSLFYYESGKNTTTYTQKDFPRTRFNLSNEKIAQAAAVCRAAGVTTEPFLNSCTMDVALTGDNTLAQSALLAQQTDKNPNKTIITPCNGNLDGKWGNLITTVYPYQMRGIVIEHKKGEGKVIVSPPDCPYKVGDIFWKNANAFNCTVEARTTNRANYSTEFATVPIVFYPNGDEIDLGGGFVTFFARIQ